MAPPCHRNWSKKHNSTFLSRFRKLIFRCPIVQIWNPLSKNFLDVQLSSNLHPFQGRVPFSGLHILVVMHFCLFLNSLSLFSNNFEHNSWHIRLETDLYRCHVSTNTYGREPKQLPRIKIQFAKGGYFKT